MKLSEAYPSAFLKAEDLNNRNVTVTIEKVVLDDIGQGQNKERKLIVSFTGKEKKLVLNKTNAGTIAKLYGDDTDGWIGRAITLTAREVEFQGDMVWAIRVSLQAPVNAGAPVNTAARPPIAPATQPLVRNENLDEDVPF